MLKPLFVLIAAATVLSACATTESYEKILRAWVGAEEIDLIRKWGTPQQHYETGGRKFLTYTSRRNVYMPGMTPSYQTTIIGNTAYTNQVGGTPGYIIGMDCVTTFELENNRIVAWQWRGNDCKARE
jgi:hypothetical protein